MMVLPSQLQMSDNPVPLVLSRFFAGSGMFFNRHNGLFFNRY